MGLGDFFMLNGKSSSSSFSPLLKFIGFISLIGLGVWVGQHLDFDVEKYRALFQSFPPLLSGFVFVLLYVVLTFFIWFGPKDVLRIASAILFGPILSTIFVTIGELINAVVLFHVSRFLGQDFVQKKFGRKKEELAPEKRDTSWLTILALRSNPLVSFRVMDLGYGLTKVSFRKYFLISLFPTPFRIAWLQYILAVSGFEVLKDPAGMMDFFSEHPQFLKWSGAYFAAVLFLSLIAVAAKLFRKKKPAVVEE